MADPVEFVVKKLPYDLSSHGGLALVGRLFKRINLPAMIDPQYPVRLGIAWDCEQIRQRPGCAGKRRSRSDKTL